MVFCIQEASIKDSLGGHEPPTHCTYIKVAVLRMPSGRGSRQLFYTHRLMGADWRQLDVTAAMLLQWFLCGNTQNKVLDTVICCL